MGIIPTRIKHPFVRILSGQKDFSDLQKAARVARRRLGACLRVGARVREARSMYACKLLSPRRIFRTPLA